METSSSSKFPRILVISNNSFSDTANNGKTLASFFNEFPVENVFQLFFKPELPNNVHYCNYYRITDYDVIKSILSRKYNCGAIIDTNKLNKTENIQKEKSSSFKMLKKYNISRIAREIIWTSKKWKTEQLDKWLNSFSPEIIFFCAGDSGFAYDITKYIKKKYCAKLVVYITDDYVLPRKNISVFWWLRRNVLLKKMRDVIQESDQFMTISDKMKDEYNKLFGKNSVLAINISESMREKTEQVENKNVLTLVYAGGLHYKRNLSLNLLARSLKKYNDDLENKKKIYLRIYSGQEPSNNILKTLNIEGASEFCGKLNPTQLKSVLNTCDIPVYVESFDKRSIEATKLSVSTKIPEYLSLGKPILAIGPNEVSSMDYLKDVAFCIIDENLIYHDLVIFIRDKELQSSLSKKALEKYEGNHNKESQVEKFRENIFDVMKK